MFVFQLAKNGTLVELFRFTPSCLFACGTINRVNLAFKTTIIEDIHLTLAVVPFKVEANKSLIFCHYKHTRKNLPSFRYFTVYNSLMKSISRFKNLSFHGDFKMGVLNVFLFELEANQCTKNSFNKLETKRRVAKSTQT